MITLKRPTLKYAKGIYARIYNECTNIRHLLELSVRDSLDLALYKRLIFMNEELDLLVRDKNAKAVRAYRRGLEEGGIPEKGLMLALLQALEHKDTRLDAAVALYYHADGLSEAKNFTEARIRCLFECLEHMCELECDVGRFKAPGATAGTASVQNVDRSDSAAGSLREIATCALYTQSDLNPSGGASNFEAPADIPRDGGVNFFKPLIGSESVQDTQQSLPEVRFNINRCNRTRVVRLLAQLYEACDHRYFYKPSYLILLRAQREHCSGESAFMERFYREFLMHTVSSRAALAKLLFPVGAQTRALRAVFNAQAERMQEELEADLGGDVWAGALLHGAAAAESPQLGVYNVCGEYEAEEGAGLSEKIKRMKAASSVQAGENRLNVFRGMIMSESAEEDGPADTHKSSDAAQPSNNLTIPTDQVLNTSLLKDLTSPPDESDFDRR
ncbi:hypothetical protein PAPHI01_0363 [Pancytospora philotis]|nr:hypothetical protein PAPHI01_0363 [Pancytospora philotis]